MNVRSVAIQMKIKHARTITLGIVGATVAAFALAACGSSSKATVSPNAQPSATTSTTGAPTTARPAVKVAMVGTVGNVLVDDTGLTLYTLTKDGAPVACTGQCATFWPPLVLPAGTTTAVGDTGVTGLGTMKVSGGLQVTDKGDPLYRFSKDTGPGDRQGRRPRDLRRRVARRAVERRGHSDPDDRRSGRRCTRPDHAADDDVELRRRLLTGCY